MSLAEYEPAVRRPVETLTRGEVDALLAQCSLRSPTGVRNRALILVMYRCGLRCQEALDLMPRDVDLAEGVLRVRHGKGDKSRVLGVPGDCGAAIALWQAARTDLGITGHRPLLCKLDGGPVDSSYVRHLFKRLGSKAGIDKRVHPHGLRHTFAHELVAEGASITTVRDALGHSSVGVTDRYLRGVSPKVVLDAMRER